MSSKKNADLHADIASIRQSQLELDNQYNPNRSAKCIFITDILSSIINIAIAVYFASGYWLLWIAAGVGLGILVWQFWNLYLVYSNQTFKKRHQKSLH